MAGERALAEGTSSRWACGFSGCDKTFARREHLTRHEQTHSSNSALHVCQVCLQEFNRSDSLQRHLLRHGDQVEPGQSRRSKKACRSCRKGKIKCDGRQPCSRCISKSIECIYEQVDVSTRSSELGNTANDVQLPHYGERASANTLLTVQTGSLSVTGRSSPEQPNIPPGLEASHQQRVDGAASSLPASAPAPEPEEPSRPRSVGFIDWSLLRIQDDNTEDTESLPLPSLDPGLDSLGVDSTAPQASDAQMQKYHAIYFTHFHHRWPLIHRPIYDNLPVDPILKLSVNMVAAWIDNSQESKKYALVAHNYLVSHICLKLSEITSSDEFQDGLPGAIGVSAILNIVFALYCGDERLVSKAVILKAILAAALREVGFFKAETVMPDDKPGFFLPPHLGLEGERQRVAACLFRIDNYLSAIRGQPPVLMPEELHFRLPTTLAGWDCKSLYVLEGRLAMEPRYQVEKTMASLILDTTSHPSRSTDDLIIVEDLQLCISAMQGKIRDFWVTFRAYPPEKEMEAARDILKRRLEKLEHRLNQISTQDTKNVKFGEEQHLPMRYYYSFEDHSKPGWQMIVSQRPATLIFDTLMLFHLLNLHLYSDVHTISQVAKDLNTTNQPILSEYHQKAQNQRIDSVRYWATTVSARRALCHAAHILYFHQNLAATQHKRSTALDPICYVALSTGALLIWTFCTFNTYQSPIWPYPSIQLNNDPATPAVNILNLCCDPRTETRMEFWVETGSGPLVEIDGVELCFANVDRLIGKFKGLIPAEWKLAASIAPSIL